MRTRSDGGLWASGVIYTEKLVVARPTGTGGGQKQNHIMPRSTWMTPLSITAWWTFSRPATQRRNYLTFHRFAAVAPYGAIIAGRWLTPAQPGSELSIAHQGASQVQQLNSNATSTEHYARQPASESSITRR